MGLLESQFEMSQIYHNISHFQPLEVVGRVARHTLKWVKI